MPRGSWIASRLGDLVAGTVLVAALLLPDRLTVTDLGAFAALPVELALGAALLLVVRPATRRPVAAVLGLLLGVLTVLKVIDIGFYATLSRPFDLVLDWRLAGGAWELLRSSIGTAGATLVGLAAVLIMVGLPVVTLWSVLRLTGLLVDGPSAATPVVAVLSAFWLTCAAAGVVVVAPYPVASRASTTKIIDEVADVRAGQLDQRVLAAELAADRYADVDPDRLLTGLRGKRVVLAFVESYGRVAIEDPGVDPPVRATLAAGDRRLAAAGLQARSGYLTSSTTGGGSWLAHATLLSGSWIDTQRRYLTLMASERFTVTEAFQRAGWRTIGVMPGVTSAWPEGSFYHYDEIHDSASLGYAGPPFTWARVPDQYTLAQLDRITSRPAGEAPTMAVVPLVTSHAPWTPVPPMLDPQRLGDGSVYGAPGGEVEAPEAIGTRAATRVRADYARSVSYSLDSLISYVSSQSGDDLVLIMVGDHQPAPVVTGAGASRDVPITLISRDPTVLARIGEWGWTPGLRPASDAPVWPMDAFRDRFLDAFSATL